MNKLSRELLLLSAMLMIIIFISNSSNAATRDLHESTNYSITGMEFVNVPRGCFIMGKDSGDTDSRPAHKVCISAFSIGTYEVTQGQWKQVMGSNPAFFKECGDNCPVEQVSWNDVQEFIRKLNSQSKITYRLPTEAEWEYACRSGGKETIYCGGDDRDNTWFRSNSGKRTHRVGTKNPNALGIYDMSGNVWEWVADWKGDYNTIHQSLDPVGPLSSEDSARVIRGGSWGSDANLVQSVQRAKSKPDSRVEELGFRLVAPEIQAEKVTSNSALTSADSNVLADLVQNITWERKRDVKERKLYIRNSAPENVIFQPNYYVYYDEDSKLYWAVPFSVDEIKSLTQVVKSNRADKLYLDVENYYDVKKQYTIFNEAQRYDKKEYLEAKNYVSTLMIDGQEGWRLPNTKDIESANPVYSGFSRTVAIMREREGGECRNDAPTYSGNNPRGCWSGAHPFIPVRPQSGYDLIIERKDLSPEKKLHELIVSIANKELGQKPLAPVPPAQPKYVEPDKLSKGEFENSKDFNKRQDTENDRIVQVNISLKSKYEAQKISYERDLGEYNKELQIIADKLKDSKVMKQGYQMAASRAFAMLYGDPLLENLKYDADKEVFSGTLKSEKGDLEQNIEVPVPINKAPQMKNRIADSKSIPVVTFKVKANNYIVSNVSIVDNAYREKSEFDAAKHLNTLEAYEVFINAHPDAPQAKLAKESIRKIKANNDLIAQSRKIAAEARRKAEEAEAKKISVAYNQVKSIGDHVCIDLKMFLYGSDLVEGFVEKIQGNKMQIRISGSGAGGTYKGTKIEKSTIIWDEYYNWRSCN